MYDFRVAVIGAGPAGLAAALTLSRAMQPFVLFDAPTPPRNAASPAIGGLAGNDRMTPDALRSTIRKEIAAYGDAQTGGGEVVRVDGDTDAGFMVATTGGSWVRVASVLLCTGTVDRFPAIEGLERFWGSSVINCPFCHGHELRDRRWGVLADRPQMLAAAEIYRMWTDDVTLFVAPGVELSPERETEILAQGTGIERLAVRRLQGEGSQLTGVELEDGTIVDLDALVLWPPQTQVPLVASLDLDVDEAGSVVVDEGFRTSREGIYAAGDLVYPDHQAVPTALHMGNKAAASIVFDLAKRGFARFHR
jgi:thioredoxin reductase